MKKGIERLDRVAAAAESSENIDEWLEKIGWKPTEEEIREDLKLLKKHVADCNNCGKKGLCRYHKTLAESLRINQKKDIGFQEEIENLVESTWLSEREAEAYLLTEELGYLVQEAADEMNVCPGRVKNIRYRIREKLEKSGETIDQIKL